jgi:hypothetical protein
LWRGRSLVTAREVNMMTLQEAMTALGSPSGVRTWVEVHAVSDAIRKAAQPTYGMSADLLSQLLMVMPQRTWTGALDRDDPGASEAFGPLVTFPDVMGTVRRSMIPHDLTIDTEDGVRKAAGTVVAPMPAARLYDILWVGFAKHGDAASAIDKYVEFATAATAADSWPDLEAALGRASVLVAVRKDKGRMPALLNAWQASAAAVRGSSYDFALARLADTFAATVLSKKSSRGKVPQAMVDDWTTYLEDLAAKQRGVDVHNGAATFECLAGWYQALQLPDAVVRSKRSLVEHLLACAGGADGLMAHSHAHVALECALRFGFSDLLAQAKAALRTAAMAAERDMKGISIPLRVPTALVDHLRRVLENAPTLSAALRSFAIVDALLVVSPERLRTQAMEFSQQSLFSQLVHTVYIGDGKTRSPTTAEARLRASEGQIIEMHLALVEATLDVVLGEVEPRLTRRTLYDAVVDWRLLGSARRPWLLRAADRFAAKDYASSGATVALVYEALLRDVLRVQGYPAQKTGSDGTITDETLGSLLQLPDVSELLGAGHVRLLQHVLCDAAYGRNVRNEVAHGTAHAETFTRARTLFLWLLVIRLSWYGLEETTDETESMDSQEDLAAVKADEGPDAD